MAVISILGGALVVIGLLLTINILPSKITYRRAIGWALATLGMVLLFVYSIISGNIVHAIVTLLFAIANAYFSVDCFKEYKK